MVPWEIGYSRSYHIGAWFCVIYIVNNMKYVFCNEINMEWGEVKNVRCHNNRPFSQYIRQISHNAPFCNRNVSVTKRCIVGFGNGASWDFCDRSIISHCLGLSHRTTINLYYPKYVLQISFWFLSKNVDDIEVNDFSNIWNLSTYICMFTDTLLIDDWYYCVCRWVSARQCQIISRYC